MLNEKSFASGRSKEVRVQSWNQTTRPQRPRRLDRRTQLGQSHSAHITLPAIDLTALAKACGGPLDGVLGVDLLEHLGVTIDLQRSVARLGIAAPSSSESFRHRGNGKAMHSCSEAFNNADADQARRLLRSRFRPQLSQRRTSRPRTGHQSFTPANIFRLVPRAHLSMTMNDQRAVGNVVWSLYDYTIESPNIHTTGRGMMLCRKSDNHWYILSMHESPNDPAAAR